MRETTRRVLTVWEDLPSYSKRTNAALASSADSLSCGFCLLHSKWKIEYAVNVSAFLERKSPSWHWDL